MREGKKDTTQGAQWICDTANSDIMHMLNQLQATATGLLRLMSKCMVSVLEDAFASKVSGTILSCKLHQHHWYKETRE